MTTIDSRGDSLVGLMRNRPVADRIAYGASALGDDGRIWIAASLLRSRSSADPWRSFGRHMTWLTVESVVVNLGLKRLFRRSRPVHDRTHPHRLRTPTDTSFPSGHSASAATMAMLLSEDGLAPLWWGLAVTIAWSRVHVGVHHPSDVAAGLAVGSAFGWVARRVQLPGLTPRSGGMGASAPTSPRDTAPREPASSTPP